MTLRQVGVERTIETAGRAGNVTTPDLVQLVDGRLVLVWAETLGQPSDRFDDTDGAIFGQILSANGLPQGETFQVNTFSDSEQVNPIVAPLAVGGFAVAWQTNARFGETVIDPDPLLQFYNADGTQKSAEPVDVLPDSPADPNINLENFTLLSFDRGAVVLDNGVTAVYNQAGGLLFFVSSGISVLQEVTSGRTDLLQLENGNIVKAAPVEFVIPAEEEDEDDTIGNIVRLFLTDTAFEAPQGIPNVGTAVPFDSIGDPTRDKDDVRLAELAGGGIVLSYTEASGPTSSRIRIETFTENGGSGTAFSIINLFYDIETARGEYDLLGLQGGGVAVVYTDEQNGAAEANVRLNLYQPDGTLDATVLVDGNRPGRQSSPELTELENGRIAVTYVDDSRTPVGGEISPLRLSFFQVAQEIGRFEGTTADDRLVGVAGNEVLQGLSGSDRIIGRDGDDTLLGGNGKDTLRGGEGDDGLRGGNGRDRIMGDEGDDGMAGGSGRDRMMGGTGDDEIGGGAGRDVMRGDDGNDLMRGNGDGDRMDGGFGDDLMRGGNGDDTIDGGAGIDRIFGERGSDQLTGGTGADVFVYRAQDSGRDQITDFDVLQDTLLIVGIDPSDVDITTRNNGSTVSYNNTDIVFSGVQIGLENLTFE